MVHISPQSVSNEPVNDYQNDVNSPFFRYSYREVEIYCLFLVLGCSILLQIDPILHSGFADIILICTAAISWITPVSGFAYIAAAQVLPIPPDSLLNPAQVGFLTWLIITPIRYKRFSLKGWQVILAFLPWLLWFWVISGENIFDPTGEYFKAIQYGIIGVQLANEARGEYSKCLMGLCLGCLAVSFGYWARQAGLPVSLSEYGGFRGDFVRLGGVRADSVMVWPPLLMGCFGFLGIVLSIIVVLGRRNLPKFFYFASFCVVFLTVPCLVATMTNGAVVGFIIMNIFLISLYLNPRNYRSISKRNKRIIRNLFLLSGAVICVFIFFNVFGISDRIIALFDFYRGQSQELGAIGSRTDVWEQAIQLIQEYPFLGVYGNDVLDQVRTVGAIQGTSFLAHNVFLDYGWQVGVPGILLLVAALILPLVYIIKLKAWLPFAGFLCFYLACIIFWMTLSFQFYKTVWSFWVLFCLAVIRWSQQRGRIFKTPKWLSL
jgi:O-antigen ligase